MAVGAPLRPLTDAMVSPKSEPPTPEKVLARPSRKYWKIRSLWVAIASRERVEASEAIKSNQKELSHLVGDERIKARVELRELDVLSLQQRDLLGVRLHTHVAVAIVGLLFLLPLGGARDGEREKDGDEDRYGIVDVGEGGDARARSLQGGDGGGDDEEDVGDDAHVPAPGRGCSGENAQEASEGAQEGAIRREQSEEEQEVHQEAIRSALRRALRRRRAHVEASGGETPPQQSLMKVERSEAKRESTLSSAAKPLTW